MIRMAGLYLKERDNGEKYFTGNTGVLNFKIFKNTFKGDNEKEPDYILYVDENKTPRPVPTIVDNEDPF